MSTPKPPAGTGPRGRKLWRTLHTNYVIADHELVLVHEAVRTVDILDRLHRASRDLTVEGSHGTKMNPCVVEARQQRLALARILVALRVPIGDQETEPVDSDEARPQLRSTRGVYQLHPGA